MWARRQAEERQRQREAEAEQRRQAVVEQRRAEARRDVERERERKRRLWFAHGGDEESFARAWPAMQERYITEKIEASRSRYEDIL
jgi:hypothetical protein